MRTREKVGRLLCGLGGAVVMATVLYLALVAPGLLTDRDSTVPARAREARR
jgi:hypothetical protein